MKLQFKGVYAMCKETDNGLRYVILPIQGLHLGGVFNHPVTKGNPEQHLLLDLTYDIDKGQYTINKAEVTHKPDMMSVCAVGAQVNTLLRQLGLYQAIKIGSKENEYHFTKF